MSVGSPSIRAALGLPAIAAMLFASGCGGNAQSVGASSRSVAVPAYASEPFTREQRLIEQGGRLIVTDGCSACHLVSRPRGVGPSFLGFAGRRVKLAKGGRVLVDEAFIRRALMHPGKFEIAGYDPTLMRHALARLRLSEQPGDVAALAAFIEQVGPEPG
jgi:hypothetical protein